MYKDVFIDHKLLAAMTRVRDSVNVMSTLSVALHKRNVDLPSPETDDYTTYELMAALAASLIIIDELNVEAIELCKPALETVDDKVSWDGAVLAAKRRIESAL